MFLLDTNIVSELRRSERMPAAAVRVIAQLDESLTFLSVVTFLEIELGIALAERRDPAKAAHLRRWFELQVMPRFAERIVDIDAAIARRCALLHVPDPRPERDSLIAATALVRGFTIVTRNEADFRAMGVPVLNPWLQP